MKKILLFLFVVTLSMVFVACGNQNTTGSIANSLKSDTQKLLSTVNELDTLNTEDILIQDISPMATANNAYSNNQNGTSLSKSYSLINNGYNGQTGYNSRQTRFYRQNNNGNGLYNNATQTARNAAYMQDLNPNQTSNVYNTNRVNRVNTNYITQNGGGYTTNQTNSRYNTNNNYNDNTINNNNNSTTRSGAYRYIPMDNQNNGNYTMYDGNFRNNFNGYMDKMQNTYNLTSDVFYANTILNECKNALREEVQKCNTLAENLKSNNITLTTDQKTALNTHLGQINATIKRLSDTKGEISKVSTKIKSLSSNYTNNTDTLNASYTKILNLISARLTECQTALDSVKACNNILTSQNGNNVNQMNYYGSQNNMSNYNAYNNGYYDGNYNNTMRVPLGARNRTTNYYSNQNNATNNTNNYANNPARPSFVSPNNNMLANNGQNNNTTYGNTTTYPNTTNTQYNTATPNNTGRTPYTTTIPQINVANQNNTATQTEITNLRNQVQSQAQQINSLQQEINRLKSNNNQTTARNTTMSTLTTPSTNFNVNPNSTITIPDTVTNINNNQNAATNNQNANNTIPNTMDANNNATPNTTNAPTTTDTNTNNTNNTNNINSANQIMQNNQPTTQYRYNA